MGLGGKRPRCPSESPVCVRCLFLLGPYDGSRFVGTTLKKPPPRETLRRTQPPSVTHPPRSAAAHALSPSVTHQTSRALPLPVHVPQRHTTALVLSEGADLSHEHSARGLGSRTTTKSRRGPLRVQRPPRHVTHLHDRQRCHFVNAERIPLFGLGVEQQLPPATLGLLQRGRCFLKQQRGAAGDVGPSRGMWRAPGRRTVRPRMWRPQKFGGGPQKRPLSALLWPLRQRVGGRSP